MVMEQTLNVWFSHNDTMSKSQYDTLKLLEIGNKKQTKKGFRLEMQKHEQIVFKIIGMYKGITRKQLLKHPLGKDYRDGTITSALSTLSRRGLIVKDTTTKPVRYKVK